MWSPGSTQRIEVYSTPRLELLGPRPKLLWPGWRPHRVKALGRRPLLHGFLDLVRHLEDRFMGAGE